MKKSREEKRKAIIDDGCSPELVAGAKFDLQFLQVLSEYIQAMLRIVRVPISYISILALLNI